MAKKSALRVSTAVVEQPIVAGRDSQPAFVIGEGDLSEGAVDADIEEKAQQIVDRLSKLALDQVTAKGPIEERWLRNLRAYHGFYDATTEAALKDAKQSTVHVKLTRAKTVTLEARLFDMIFPTDDRNWGIEATPVPKLGKEVKEATDRAQNAAMQASDAAAAGDAAQEAQIIEEGNVEASRAQAAQAEIAKAGQTSDLMQEEMDDQLVESLYPQESREMLPDASLLGTGILKGPLVHTSTRGSWMPALDKDGNTIPDQFQLEYREDPRPKITRTDPWAFFPDMSARTIEEAEFTFERYLWSARDLRRLVKTDGFNPRAVRELLQDGVPNRTKRAAATGLTYLTQIREITGEGSGTIKGRYVGWEYHGALECSEVATLLRAMGKEEMAREYEEVDDPLNEFRVICYFAENTLLKIAPEYPLDSGDTMYSVYNIEKAEGTIFGYGIPEIMADSATAINAAWRMALDNGGLSVGPQVLVDKTQIEPADGDWAMKPKKVWLRTKSAVPNTQQPLEFFNVQNNMNEISSIIKIALEFVDMETGISQPQQGEQGNATKTVGGMAILENASNIIFRRMVKNYDDGIITPTMRRLYDWNMQHSKRTDIKGDMSIDARGTSVLLVKEIQAQNLMFIVSTLLNNPAVAPMLKPYENIQKLFQSMMISPSDVMETKDDWMANVKRQAEAAAKQPDPATINAQSRIEAANVMAQARGVSDETSLMIAQLRERSQLLQLVENGKMTMAEYHVQVEKTRMEIESKERMMAAELGFEKQNADEARAAGENPTGSGGFVSTGTTDDKADGQ